jgi:hypothetical protein
MNEGDGPTELRTVAGMPSFLHRSLFQHFRSMRMVPDSPSSPPLDRSGRLNAALIRRGAKSITTDATGSINLVMLIDEMRVLGMAMSTCLPNAQGIFKVHFVRQGAKRGDPAVQTPMQSVSRESAIVDAALAAL